MSEAVGVQEARLVQGDVSRMCPESPEGWVIDGKDLTQDSGFCFKLRADCIPSVTNAVLIELW